MPVINVKSMIKAKNTSVSLDVTNHLLKVKEDINIGIVIMIKKIKMCVKQHKVASNLDSFGVWFSSIVSLNILIIVYSYGI